MVELNPLLWRPLLNAVILPLRAGRSAAMYRRIWTEEGSPLLVFTREQKALLSARLELTHPRVRVAFGMRYGEPSLRQGVDELCAAGCENLVLLPLFPQYSAATTASVCDAVFADLSRRRRMPALRVVEPFCRHPAYIGALAARINAGLEEHKPEALLLSYHGIPLSYAEKGDPYPEMCLETTRLLTPLLRIAADRVVHCYQSRFGRGRWLGPATARVAEEMGRGGVKRLAVASPAFTCDCLETLYEIKAEMRDIFTKAGGSRLDLIPCLNGDPAWIEALARIAEPYLTMELRP